MKKFLNSKYIAILIAGFIIVSSFNFHVTHSSLNVISWDVYGYYLYLPAILKYGDTSQYQFVYEHLQNYPISEQIYQVMDWNGVKAPIYTIGMAILYLPFYLVADLMAHLIPGIKADGLSAPYQWGIIVAGWVYTVTGLIYGRKLLQSVKVADHIISIVLLIFFLGTNYFHYAAFENGMPHAFLFSLYVVLLYCIVRWHKDKKHKHLLLGAGILALLCLARPSEGIAIILVLGYGIYNGLSFLIKLNLIIKQFRQVLLFILTGISIVAIQIIYWKWNIGEWIFNGYQEHHFDWTQPHILEGLFSYRKGWLLYSPLMILGLAGIPVVYFRDKRWFYPVLIFTILNIYIVLSWHIWWYASSFGMRALIQGSAILVVPTAFLLDKWWQQRSFRWLVLIIVGLGVTFNQFQDWQYRQKILLQDGMNATFYWKSFLKTDLDKTLRKYVDNPDEYKGNQDPQIMETFIADSSKVWKDEKWAEQVLPNRYSHTFRIPAKEIPAKWIHTEAAIYLEGEKFNDYNQAQLVHVIKTPQESFHWKGVRFQRYLPVEEWVSTDIDYLLPETDHSGAYLEVTIWNNGPDTIYLHSLELGYYPE